MSQLGFDLKDAETHKRSRSGGKKARSALAVSMALLVIAGVIGGAVFAFSKVDLSSEPTDFAGEGSGSVLITVENGMTIAQIGQALKKNGVVATVDGWIAACQGDGRCGSIGPATYTMRKQMNAQSAIDLMLDPAARSVNRLLIKEGMRSWDVYAAASKFTGIPVKQFERAAQDPDLGLPDYAKGNAEGFLFPATYEIEPKFTALEILQQMVRKYKQVSKNMNFEQKAEAVGMSPYEALITASLVQSEGHPSDFGQVSRVIHNRLGKDTWGGTYGLLQLDATINYALRKSEIILTDAQLQQDGPYNTYTRPGLPPTPISQPGEAAMKAAVTPEDGDWLYYVTVDPSTGKTKFTASYEEFLQFKSELQNNLKNG